MVKMKMNWRMTKCHVLNQIGVRSTAREEELNSTPHALLKLVLALQRALPAEVPVRSSLVALVSILLQQKSSIALPTAGQLLVSSLSTRSLSADWSTVPSLSADWSTVQSLSIRSLSADQSMVRSLSTRSLSAEQSRAEQQSTELFQTTVVHRAALSDVGFR